MTTLLHRTIRVAAFAAAFGLASHANAAPVFFSADDPGAGPGDARPGSDAAAAAWDVAAGALGAINLIDFESLAVEFFSGAKSIGAGVTATLSDDIDSSSPFGSGVRNDRQDENIGFNTTAGGENFLRVTPEFGFASAVLDIDFDDPIQAFGAYVTDVEDDFAGDVEVTFDDGSVQTFSLITSTEAGVQFFGFTDAGKLITSVRFDETATPGLGGRDIWAIDDIRYVAADVPAPGTLVLVGLALAALGLRRRAG